MKVLRDLRLSTKMLIMLELINDPKTTLKPIAEKLEMTVQGISEYLRRMQEERLIQRLPSEYKLTKKGVQFLHENILELRDFVVAAIKRVEIIQTCVSVARTRIKAGDKVGLFMENGILTAYANKASSSTGTALVNAEAGEDIPIKDLKGIVELFPGMLMIIELPSIENKGTHTVPVGKAGKVISKLKYDRLGALDAVGMVLAHKLGLKCDIEFAVVSAGIEAVQKGLNVVLLGSSDEAHRLVSTIEEINARTADKIRYELVRVKSNSTG